MILIVISCRCILSLSNFLDQHVESGLVDTHAFFCIKSNTNRIADARCIEPRVKLVIGKERRCIGTGMTRVIVSKLGQRQESFPVVLLIINISTQVLFKGLIGALCLSVCLGVKNS